MNTVTQSPAPRQMKAAVAALMLWYPNMSLRLIEAIRRGRPSYPLVNGGLAQQGRVHA